ncbi:MAG: CARDB domain-containing protein, partial [Planctomycetota bacterium]
MARRKKNRKDTQFGPRIEKLEHRKLFANGAAVVQLLTPPDELVSDEPVDIDVRFKLSGNSKSGPWKVNRLALFDKDPGVDDKMIQTSSLQVEEQDRWYYHTFQNVDLADYVDGPDDAVELYAQVKIDDKTWNGRDAKDESRVHDVQALADLEVSGVRLSDYTVEPGQKIWVHFDVENNGIVQSKSGHTGVMLSTNSYISRSDQLLDKEWVWRIGAGNSKSESRRITIPHDAPIGSTFYVGTIADYDDDNPEGSGEHNNNTATARRITIVDPRADLTVDSLSLEHVKSSTTVDIASPGQRIKTHAVIGNDGNSRAWRFNVDFYWSSKPWGLDTKLADNWVFFVSPGNHNTERARFTVPDVPSGMYYVTARADSESEVSESDESNNLMTVPIEVYNPNDFVADFTPGVTIITAGFQASGTQNGSPQDYTIEMAEAILERAYGVGTERGSVFISDPHTGMWVNPNVRFAGDDDGFGNWRENSNDPNDEIVLIYDWSWESNDFLDKGWSEAAGDNLFASLADPLMMVGEPVDLLQRPLHFIGASRGTVVNTHAVQRIDHHFPEVTVDHFTTLDPHPARGPFGAIDDYGSDIQKLILPDNVVYADNFYRQDWLYEADLDFNGVEVPGAVNLELNEWALQLAGSPLEHADVPTWYLATIKPDADEVNGAPVDRWRFADWWVSGKGYDETVEPLSGRGLIGYAYSRIGGRDQKMHLMDHAQFTYDTAPASVFNGDFEYGDTLVGLENIPGWE